MIRIGLIGFKGRMGKAFSDYQALVADFEVCAAIDYGDDLALLIDQTPDVVLDLSLGSAVTENCVGIISSKLPYIIGASGVTTETLETIEKLTNQHGSPVLLVPNFSIGATLMMSFAEKAAKYMDAPVITERHHDRKADAPSGTALHTAERMEAVLADTQNQRAYTESLAGVMGGSTGSVSIHSVRGSGFLAEQEVQFNLPGEVLRIEHRSIDRGGFMAGIDYAIRNIGNVQGLQVGLDTILDI